MYYNAPPPFDNLPDPWTNKAAFEATVRSMSKGQLLALLPVVTGMKRLGVAVALQKFHGVSQEQIAAALSGGAGSGDFAAPTTTTEVSSGGGIACGIANAMLGALIGGVVGTLLPGVTVGQAAKFGAIAGGLAGLTGITPCKGMVTTRTYP